MGGGGKKKATSALVGPKDFQISEFQGSLKNKKYILVVRLAIGTLYLLILKSSHTRQQTLWKSHQKAREDRSRRN